MFLNPEKKSIFDIHLEITEIYSFLITAWLWKLTENCLLNTQYPFCKRFLGHPVLFFVNKDTSGSAMSSFARLNFKCYTEYAFKGETLYAQNLIGPKFFNQSLDLLSWIPF